MNLSVLLIFTALLTGCSSIQVNRISLEKKMAGVNPVGFGLGGLSALHRVRKISENQYEFLSLTDRGPNGMEFKKDGILYRPFNDPQFVPGFFKFELNIKNNEVSHFEFHPMITKNGEMMSGLPPDLREIKNPEFETAIFGENTEKPLSYSKYGIDSESVSTDDFGNIWVGEEYRPGILKFNSNYQLLEIHSPGTGVHDLTEQLKYRALNRGFEGLAFANNCKIYAILQSALRNPNNSNNPKGDLARIIEFDIKTKTVTAQYLYPLDNPKYSKIGDLTALPDGSFLIIEQNGKKGKEGIHSIYRFKLDMEKKISSSATEPIENSGPILKKELIVTLEDLGVNEFEKIEGLTWVDSRTLVLLNDNDFRVQGKDQPEDSVLITVQFPKSLF
jgi:hypothetical protein